MCSCTHKVPTSLACGQSVIVMMIVNGGAVVDVGDMDNVYEWIRNRFCMFV